MKTKSKEKVYAERQHNYKTKKEDPYLPVTFTLGCFVA